MDVAWLERKLTAGEEGELLAKLEAMSRLLLHHGERSVDLADLRPGVLDELGLEAAVEWAVGEFAERTGVQCRFASSLNGADRGPPRPPPRFFAFFSRRR